MQQIGFDLEYTDPITKEAVPWALPDRKLLAEIAQASWKVCDLETTGLNPASKEQKFTAKELRRGIDPKLRIRVASVLYYGPNGKNVVAFDFDQMTNAEKGDICTAVLTNVLINHNVGFDAYWLTRRSPVRPTLMLDTMLISRVLFPEAPLVMAKLCSDEGADPVLRAEAESMFQQGRSGWALRDLMMARLQVILDKGLQGPKNWAEPFLSQAAYDYGTGDVIHTFELLLSLLHLEEWEVAENPDLLLARYEEFKEHAPALTIIEPQVADVIEMRSQGMPWAEDEAERYVQSQWAKVAECAQLMVEMEPSLAPFLGDMKEPEKGVTANLKTAIGEAFSKRGIALEVTEKAGTFKIGEKDLRRAKAQINPEAQLLFEVWVKMNRAKKAGGMAKEFTAFARRSGDCRLHPNTGHGPVTGRLSSSEPNCQQMPRDQGFRSCVMARPAHSIIASDYSALDMRVGAALAIRAQQHIVEAYMGDRVVDLDVRRVIERVFEGKISLEAAITEEARANKEFETWKARREDIADNSDARKSYWDAYRKKARTQLLAGFQRCLKEVRTRADADGTAEWGSLRDAFSIDGMDIHTWTALSMIGQDPKALFMGLKGEDFTKELKRWKKELGDKRQTGKVGNLSLLYAMKTLGLVEAAAKNYNIHWTFDEGEKVRKDWLAAYVEVDLWHKWMELTPADSVYIPDPDRGNRYSKKPVFRSFTLGNRLIYAFGLNAALSYEDQSTGADILGRVMRTLRNDYPQIFACVINQVHDELVFECPDEVVEEWTQTIQDVMTECAEFFLMQFGVKGECSPAVGKVWLKD
jgi:hypothetical protein